MQYSSDEVPKMKLWKRGVIFIAGSIFLIVGILSLPHRAAISSAEVSFVEVSAGGLGIIPASCASSPTYYHIKLARTSDLHGFISYNGQTQDFGEYLDYGGGVVRYFCVSNSSGSAIFIPAHTALELDYFKYYGASIPGVVIN